MESGLAGVLTITFGQNLKEEEDWFEFDTKFE
jgi:hypothetical protein